jgi:hypothetical protein
LPCPCLRRFRDRVAPPNAAGDGLLQSVGRLDEGAIEVISLGDGLRHILESDHEAAIGLVRSEGYGIGEVKTHAE